MTNIEARKDILFAASPKGFHNAMRVLLEEKNAAVVKEIYIDLKSRLVEWSLVKILSRQEIAAAAEACEAFLQENIPAEELKEAVACVNPSVEAAKSIEQAVEKTLEEAKPEDVVIIFGSLSFLGEAERNVKKWKEKQDGLQ